MNRSRPSPVRRMQQPDRARVSASESAGSTSANVAPSPNLAPPPFISIAEPPCAAAQTDHNSIAAPSAPSAPKSELAEPRRGGSPAGARQAARQATRQRDENVVDTTEKYEVFRPRYPTLRADSTLDVTLALCLARVPSELTAVHVDHFDVVPDITSRHDIRPHEVMDVRGETASAQIREVSCGFVRKHFQLKGMRSDIRKQRVESKLRVAESEDVIKAMFARLSAEGRPKTSMSVTVNGLDGSRYEHVVTVSGLDEEATSRNSGTGAGGSGADARSDSESESDSGSDAGENSSDSGSAQKNRHGFIRTPPSGAFTNIVHMAVRGALVALQMGSSIGARSNRDVVWNLLRSSDFQREFMARCISLSAKYNEEKRASTRACRDSTSRVRLKTARRELGHVPASYASRRVSRHVDARADPRQQQLPRPPMS